ncbi:sodium-extruding oxaloacetate decarboxylase subunit alpha [Microbulbifer thermotolerans]|uniref:Oxaloacetate decarboxylase n=1 Tax=Microbulbifer thermotolerans TaxID=252514 RepID=A0A143HMZ7_MICTH|nr:sodium-extruding oxaloacetate decarboxylase subunit alpha [Microbulbifer thermotolerans]AMX02830.1 oxaloacetate decarboxylase [Microbulbifer thermotolerans]MCX2782661.1 sodium-extruding oxaloacetate decarboxylase subunit alpha [Microbulbifer thermotolerans]MCX2794674.1 sodium-extruding oxaloacetate decarboxylase subunit alpha [Microbulbifer thermotolerans]MCX2801501.1 sodium-extruding oxaloacetate decarboxylase subunit alpha [Microbulbifer thermotolerans]MCX2831762.1 sodium-extruding oxaloa
MTEVKKPLGITDVVLRDAHQSLFATRLRLDDMLPIAEKLDKVGFWSLESWGGATFDACIRYLGEDPWERIRELKKAMPNTPQQMLFRGQNILGYRHYADDVVEKFVERAAKNGVDVFRVFDAMNDMRNLGTALKAVKKQGKHAQGTISYTVSPVHTMDLWVDLGRQIEDMGADSICIKDMAGLLRPYEGYELVKRLKAAVDIPIHMQCHATTGLSTATALKCIEAGIDNVDTAISSMSMTYGHSPTEALVAILENTDRDTGLDIKLLEEIAAYFREVRKKYAKFEGSLRGVDSRILVAQVPGGMLTNMENQLREQGAGDRLDEVLEEIPRVREDLGFIPLVTPTSQIVGTQAVLNVLTGERYKSISKETAAVLKGEYGSTPAPVNKELQARVLEGAEPISCRPADQLQPELEKLTAELKEKAAEQQIALTEGEGEIDDVLTYALFPQIGLKFLSNRGNPDAFEPVPTGNEGSAVKNDKGEEVYTVTVEGKSYTVTVADGGDLTSVTPVASEAASPAGAAAPVSGGEPVKAPLAGNIFKVLVKPGDQVTEGQTIIVLEAMKMETAVSAPRAGSVTSVSVKEGDSVAVGDALLSIA